MARVTWGPSLQVGFGDIDAQHERLVRLLNELQDVHEQQRPREHVGDVLDELVRYTRLHFAFEEKLMATHGLVDQHHVEEHERLTHDVATFAERYRSGESDLTDELVAFLHDWLKIHIRKDDREFAQQLLAKGAGSAA